MLYLAEVVLKRGLMGSKGELKLLACQKGEQWNAVNNEDPLSTDDLGNHKDGALVLVDLTGAGSDRKIQRIQEGGRQIVTLLQTYSRQQEKSKSQEEEIQQWMESLTFQSQELNRREMELESRREQLEQLEREVQQLERKRDEIQHAQESSERLRAEIERRNQEVEQAWAQLRQQQEQLQQSSSLDAAQAQVLKNLLNEATGSVVAADFLKTSAQTCLQIAVAQETILQGAPTGDNSQERQAIADGWAQWHVQAGELAQMRSELRGKQVAIETKQHHIEALNRQIEGQAELVSLLEQMAISGNESAQRVDVAALEAMELEALQDLTVRLQKDFEKVSTFVSDQEEELRLQHQTIEELGEKIRQAGEFDRISMEKNLEDERENYRMLNETLVGQRRNLHERESIFRVHQRILDQRQGIPPSIQDGVDVTPAIDRARAQLQSLETLRQQNQDELAGLYAAVSEAEAAIGHKAGEVERYQNELRDRERAFLDHQSSGGALLEPLVEQVSGLKDHLEALVGNLDQANHTVQAQEQALGQIRTILEALAK